MPVKQLDIKISSSEQRRKNPPDAFCPREFPGREKKIHHFPEVASTMEIARKFAKKGCPHFTVIIADRQTKGRGRLSRKWLSSDGGLYFTIVLRPETPPVLSFKFNFAASLVLARTLRSMHGVDAKVKWPNDVIVKKKKISGILAEMEAGVDRIKFINIGIGLNMNNDPSFFEPGACSLKSLLKKETSRKNMLAKFLDEYESFLNSGGMDDVAGEWKKETATIGRQVKIETVNNVYEGIASDVDENGSLLMTIADGSTKRVIHGDCFHMRQSF